LTQLSPRRIDPKLAAGLWVDEPELSDVRQLLLAPVADLDGRDVVAAGQLQQRAAPVAGPAEVGDDEDQRALARDACGAGERPADRRRADGLGLRLAPKLQQHPEEPDPALARRKRARVPVAERD